MIKVEKDHFLRAALEIGHSGDNDTLPYDWDAGFIKEKGTRSCGPLPEFVPARRNWRRWEASHFHERALDCGRTFTRPVRAAWLPYHYQNSSLLEPLSEWTRSSDCGGERRTAERPRAFLSASSLGAWPLRSNAIVACV